MTAQRNYGPLSSQFFRVDSFHDLMINAPRHGFPEFSTEPPGICPIHPPGPVGKDIGQARTPGGQLLESIESAQHLEFNLPIAAPAFDNKWATGVVEIFLATKQEAAGATSTLKIKGDRLTNGLRAQFKQAIISHKHAISDALAITLESNVHKTQANFERFEKGLQSTYGQKPVYWNKMSPKRQQRWLRKRKPQYSLEDLIPVLALGIEFKDTDSENWIFDVMDRLGVLKILRKAGAKDFGSASGEFKVQTTEHPFVFEFEADCKFAKPPGEKGFDEIKGGIKVKINFRPKLEWFARIASLVSQSRVGLMASALAKNIRVLETIARYAGITMRVAGRVFIVVGFILGIIDIGRLVYHAYLSLELELEARQRLAAIARDINDELAHLGCWVYAWAYADKLFPGEINMNTATGVRGFKTGLELTGRDPEEGYLALVRQARRDCQKNAEQACASIKLPDHLVGQRGMLEEQMTRQMQREHFYLSVYQFAMGQQFASAEQLARKIADLRKKQLR